ncbi:HNH endonuclease [Actinospica robiniae]|uniref:HNH endonuclease n=1 Tax=Actinospica robiniae TaxID=304901 RepID=UPI0009FE9E98|nr:HNH endonuclease [Actinospica robiniae]
MPHTLVLNASYEPLCVVPQRRAVVLVLNRKAVTLEGTGASLHAAGARGVGWELPAPSVVKLTRYVRVPLRRGVPLTRRAIFARDGGRCVYCDAPATSVDHVIPRSRGGQHAWDNVVSSCRRCNHVKADRPLPELGWRMKRTPVQPNGSAWRILSSGRTDQRWLPYLRGYGVDLELLPFEPQGPDGVSIPIGVPAVQGGPIATAVAIVAAPAPAPTAGPVTPLAA